MDVKALFEVANSIGAWSGVPEAMLDIYNYAVIRVSKDLIINNWKRWLLGALDG